MYLSVRECAIDYLIETTCICICALLCFYHVEFYVLIILISVKRHKLWCTVRDMRLSKCSIIIIIKTVVSVCLLEEFQIGLKIYHFYFLHFIFKNFVMFRDLVILKLLIAVGKVVLHVKNFFATNSLLCCSSI